MIISSAFDFYNKLKINNIPITKHARINFIGNDNYLVQIENWSLDCLKNGIGPWGSLPYPDTEKVQNKYLTYYKLESYLRYKAFINYPEDPDSPPQDYFFVDEIWKSAGDNIYNWDHIQMSLWYKKQIIYI